MEGYIKTRLVNHKGEQILPWTTASLVSEESDKRFVDNVEKEILNKIATEKVAIDELVNNYQALSALASEELSILNLIDTVPTDLYEWGDTLGSLAIMKPFAEQIISSLGASPEVTSTRSGYTYSIQVNDENESSPYLTLVKTDTGEVQPSSYTEGDMWYVPMNAPDVKVEVPVSRIVFSNNKKTILTFAEGLLAAGVNATVMQNIVNGAQNEGTKSTGENIAQIFAQFDTSQYLSSAFGLQDLDSTITRFNLEVLSQPLGTTTLAKTQMYLTGNVVQPTREATRRNDYTTNTFTHLTWQTSLDSTFIKKDFLNNQGIAAVSVYGGAGSEVSISKPKLTIHITNPYRGKALVAKKTQTGEFNILDWKVQD